MDREMFRALRQFHKLTQQQFAEVLGVAPSTVDSVETGRRPFSSFVRGKVAAAYQLDEAFLKFYDNYKSIDFHK